MPWDRLPKESDKAFDTFRLYLMMGADRTYQKVADATQRYISHIKLWGSKYSWKQRAAEYDNWIARNTDSKAMGELSVFQSAVIQSEMEDYIRLRDLWKQQFEAIENSLESTDPGEIMAMLNRLIRARDSLSVLSRRAAHLPMTYKPKEEEPQELSETWILAWEKSGEIVQGSSPTLAPGSEEDSGESGTIQGGGGGETVREVDSGSDPVRGQSDQ